MSIANATKTAASTSLLEDATPVPKKFGNIRDLEWLPVVDSNGRRMVGLDELFTSAHLIKSIDVRAPIERAGVLRFLTTVTALVARAQGITTASAAEVARTGFDDGAVRRALDAIDDRLWLIHPDTPFMQEGRYATATSATKNAESIRSTSPGDSSKAWWGRAGDGFATGHLKVTDAPAALAGFWFYSTNNNGKVTLAEGSVAQQGSAAGKVVAAGIRLWKTGASLAQTLLFNTPEVWIRGAELPAWAQTLSGSGSLDPFVTATITGNATLLLPEWIDGQLTFTSAHVGGVLRKGIPAPADAPKDSSPTALDALKASLLYAWHADPQIVFRKQDPKKKELVGLEKVRALNDMSAGTSTLHNLSAWYLRAFNPDVPSSSILVSETFTIELFSLQLAQKGSYGEISGASWLSMPTGTVGGSPEAQEALRLFADYAYGHVRRALYVAVRDVLGDDGATDSTFENALTLFTSRSERVVVDVIALALKGETFTIEHVKRWVRSAMDAFDEAVTPFSNARTISDIARARQNLFHRINQTESD